MSFAEMPIGVRMDEGEDGSTGEYDYSHMLTPEHRAAGYQLVVRHDNDGGTLDVDINHQGNYVGGVNTFLHDSVASLADPRQRHRAMEFHLSDLEDEHQGRGLGPAAYKAAIVHGRSLLGITHVRGGDHSTQAHRVHEKIASELGVIYHAQSKPKTTGYQGYNKQYGEYEYPILKRSAELESLPSAEEINALKVKPMAGDDFKHIVGAIDENGANVVDHTPHLKTHPPELEHDVGYYAQTFLHTPSIVRKVKSPKLGGISKKVVFNDGSGNSFMVKPYHERVSRGVSQWMHRAHQGCAEMTNQALFHAAGIGHLHQKVHVAEHNMGPGHENEPGVVVHMEPGMDTVSNMPATEFDPSMLHDTTKITAMDYLANNLDRHGENMMFRKLTNHDPSRNASRLLAIDHGRNFQYKSKSKTRTAGVPKEFNLEDNLHNYLGSGPGYKIGLYSQQKGGPHINNMQHFVSSMVNWWPQVRNGVVQTMHQHLKQIKDQDHRTHIWVNFMERVEKLDDMVRYPDEFIDADRSLFATPIYTPEETKTTANQYNPWQVF